MSHNEELLRAASDTLSRWAVSEIDNLRYKNNQLQMTANHLRIINASLLAACERFVEDWNDDKVYQSISHTTIQQAKIAIVLAKEKL